MQEQKKQTNAVPEQKKQTNATPEQQKQNNNDQKINTDLIIKIHNYLENIYGPINVAYNCANKNSFMNIAFGNPYGIQFGTVFSFKKSDIDEMFKNASNNDKIQLAQILHHNYDINNKTEYPIEIEYSELIKLPQLIVNDKKMDGSCMLDCLQVLNNKIAEKKASRSKLSSSISYLCFGLGFLSTAITIAGFVVPQLWVLKIIGFSLGGFFAILTVATRVKNMINELRRQNNSKNIENLTKSAEQTRKSVENMAINNNKQQNNSKETKTTNEQQQKKETNGQQQKETQETNKNQNAENLIKEDNKNENINTNNKEIVTSEKEKEIEQPVIVPPMFKDDEKKRQLEEKRNLLKQKQQLQELLQKQINQQQKKETNETNNESLETENNNKNIDINSILNTLQTNKNINVDNTNNENSVTQTNNENENINQNIDNSNINNEETKEANAEQNTQNTQTENKPTTNGQLINLDNLTANQALIR